MRLFLPISNTLDIHYRENGKETEWRKPGLLLCLEKIGFWTKKEAGKAGEVFKRRNALVPHPTPHVAREKSRSISREITRKSGILYSNWHWHSTKQYSRCLCHWTKKISFPTLKYYLRYQCHAFKGKILLLCCNFFPIFPLEYFNGMWISHNKCQAIFWEVMKLWWEESLILAMKRWFLP